MNDEDYCIHEHTTLGTTWPGCLCTDTTDEALDAWTSIGTSDSSD